uniref:Uncharacterized protein n=1 Tax=Arundo donax TaxID=35708 RepID=A0A0A8YLB6_ARUDO
MCAPVTKNVACLRYKFENCKFKFQTYRLHFILYLSY